MIYIYTLFNNQNYKVYVGQTQNIKKRWYSHKSEAKSNKLQYPLYRAMRKYGINNFQLSIVEALSSEEANLSEQKWIQLLDSRSPNMGYNLSLGGLVPRGWFHTEESKRKISESQKGKIISEETKQKISEATSGEKHRNYGKHLLDSTKEKISIRNCGKPKSSEARNNMSKSKIGKKLSNDHKSSISKSQIKRQKNSNKELCNLSKLNYNLVSKIRSEWLTANVSQKELSVKYGVNKTTISRIVNYKIWIS